MRIAPACVIGLAALVLWSCSRPHSGKPTVDVKNLELAFVTNNSSSFWTIARRGCEKAEQELENVRVKFLVPEEGTAVQQNKIIEALLAGGVDGIAISPVDPESQTAMLNKVAKKTLLVTQDSDAPKSDRACYIGTDNRSAGRQAGELIKEAIPGGGKVIVFAGRIDAQNARERLEGIKEAIQGSRAEILEVRTDDNDPSRAKAGVTDALVTYPEVKCLVGLWSYNGPAILSAVREAGKAGRVKIICFDEEEETLAGVKEGQIYATIVQQPFEFGRQAIILMTKYLRGDESAFPADRKVIVPMLVVRQEDVAAFRRRSRE